jgi:hypothetical protein
VKYPIAFAVQQAEDVERLGVSGTKELGILTESQEISR